MSDLQPLGRDALTVRRVRIVFTTLLMLVVALGIVSALPGVTGIEIPWWAVIPVIAAAAGLAWWWVGVDHARWGWRLTEDLLEVRRGVLVRRTYLVPRSRIQNVTTTAGPLQSRYGVLTLNVHTAGARTRNVSIEDIDAGHAAAIRRRLGLT